MCVCERERGGGEGIHVPFAVRVGLYSYPVEEGMRTNQYRSSTGKEQMDECTDGQIASGLRSQKH